MFNGNNCFTQWVYTWRNSHRKCSIKKKFLRTSQNSRRAPEWESLFKLSCRPGLQLYLKKAPPQVFSWDISEIFKNTFFIQHPGATASVLDIMVLCKKGVQVAVLQCSGILATIKCLITSHVTHSGSLAHISLKYHKKGMIFDFHLRHSNKMYENRRNWNLILDGKTTSLWFIEALFYWILGEIKKACFICFKVIWNILSIST